MEAAITGLALAFVSLLLFFVDTVRRWHLLHRRLRPENGYPVAGSTTISARAREGTSPLLVN